MDKTELLNEAEDNSDEYGPLSNYMAKPTTSLHQYPDKVHFKLNLLHTEKNTLLDVTLEIPDQFKNSLFCRAIIAYCYADEFKALADVTKKSYLGLFNQFFCFLLMHDEKCETEKSWFELIAIGSDLPHTVIHEFLMHLSEKGTGANTLYEYRLDLKKPIKWATSINLDTGNYNLKNSDKLKPYLKKNVSPEIKKDDAKPKIALSQVFSMDYETGEVIECPYSDSQLVTNLRWFAHWYLKLMRERRLFLRTIMWDETRTIYDVLNERLNNGTWSLYSNPVASMFGRHTKADKEATLYQFTEASSMYAKIYEALLPSSSELELIEKNEISVDLEKRLLWQEPSAFNITQIKKLFSDLPCTQSNAEKIVNRIKNSITHTFPNGCGKGEKVSVPIVLTSNLGRRSHIKPIFGLVDMILPTDSECLVMSWLLSSDCLQWSNQIRLQLNDFKQLERGKVLKIYTSDTSDDININEAKIRHYKGRGKGNNSRAKGKKHETITYKKGDPLLMTYTNWVEDMTQAQIYIKKYQGNFFHNSLLRLSNKASALLPLSFLCAATSIIKASFKKAESELKYRSDVNGQGAFVWLLSTHIKHYAFRINNEKGAPEINLSPDVIRQSRIIFNEGQNMTDAEIAKETAHNEDQVVNYREAGVAKERILNGIKGNVQVANKMADEAISILDSCHILSVEEVRNSLHTPTGINCTDILSLVNDVAANSDKYDVTIFGGIVDKSDPQSGIKIINDKNSAMMMYSYIKHMESELQSIEENHDEEQIVKHLFEHAQWSILFERFPKETQNQAIKLAEKYTIPYPPLF